MGAAGKGHWTSQKPEQNQKGHRNGARGDQGKAILEGRAGSRRTQCQSGYTAFFLRTCRPRDTPHVHQDAH